MAISKKIRFEVFKRDSFTCQYCGRAAPATILQVDHIHPISKEGNDDILNLITSCHDCNQGKRATLLTDGHVLTKRKRQLDILQKRREQIEMMADWVEELSDLDNIQLESMSKAWRKIAYPYKLTQRGQDKLRKLLGRYGTQDIIKAMMAAASQYIEKDGDGVLIPDSVEKAWAYVERICAFNKRNETKPHMRDIFYIRGIMRNRFSYTNEQDALILMQKAYDLGADIEFLRSLAIECHNWSSWITEIKDYIQGAHDIRE